MKPSHALMKKFRVEELGVGEFDHWIVTVRVKQITVGACVFLLKRPEPSLGGVTPEEMAELPEVARWWETKVRELWSPDRFNYVAAMMKDPFVHFHAIPRYESPRRLNGSTYVDVSWPGLVEFRELVTPVGDLEEVRRSLAK